MFSHPLTSRARILIQLGDYDMEKSLFALSVAAEGFKYRAIPIRIMDSKDFETSYTI